ncbi:hypothetical protein Pvag_pPag30469 (plasmid) [Pantoea vagans C9-1]|nr:hypothetical protein Pvag_pPag30469 [Pantoea vagans C9-1]
MLSGIKRPCRDRLPLSETVRQTTLRVIHYAAAAER